MTMLRLSEIFFAYGKRPVLSGLSFETESGTISAVLGPNGAGKSTLLDICLGWRKPNAGSVTIEGNGLDAMSTRDRGKIVSLVPQRENIRFDFPVLEYVLLGRAPHLPPLAVPGPADTAIAIEALGTVGIAHLAERQVAQISGGEYQLMLIARSLTQQPRLLLLDEPTSQLDPAHRIEVLRVLKRLAAAGITVFLTSHSPETAALVADRIHLLHGGAIVVSGPPREVLTEEHLEAAYGVEFHIAWWEGVPRFGWDV
jgi:iron complex transport system ATP-binding protein